MYSSEQISLIRRKYPRVGWSEILGQRKTYYFVHSYCMTVKEVADYKIEICEDDNVVASVEKDNILAMQYHQKK